ncbi:hypothetical protein D030_0755A, partial [Vibrio parahaemolyticus AQ3810]
MSRDQQQIQRQHSQCFSRG